MHEEELFMRICMFLTVWTAIIGVVNMAYAGSLNIHNVGATFSSGSIPGQIGGTYNPNTESSYSQNYTTTTGYDTNITQPAGYWGLNPTVPIWTQSSVGYTCTQVPVYPPFQPALLQLNGVTQNAAGTYDVTYYINNAPGTTFYTAVYNFDTGLWVAYDTAGVHLQNLGGTGFSSDVVPYIQYPNAQVTSGVTTYETQYNPTANTLTVIIGGQNVGTFQNVPTGGTGYYQSGTNTNGAYSGELYGGVATFSTGFNLNQVLSTFQVINTSTYGQSSGFLQFIGAIIGMSNDALIPWWFWSIVGLPCIATLGFMLAKYIASLIP